MKLLVLSLWLTVALVNGQIRQAASGETSGSNLPIQPIGANDLVAVSVLAFAESGFGGGAFAELNAPMFQSKGVQRVELSCCAPHT